MRPMQRRGFGVLLLFLAGCHNPADDFAKLDVENPASASGWAQFRHGPGGYAFQAPKAWTLAAQDEADRRLSENGLAADLFVRLADVDAARKGDLVTFAVTRLAGLEDDDLDHLDRLKVYRLDEIGEKVLRGFKADVPNAKRERIRLPIGSAEHVWGTLERALPDGRRETMSSHIVAFATALRPFVLVYVYPASKEREYRPTLDAMVRTVRLFRPEKAGKVEIPESARGAMTFAPVPYGQPGAPNPATSFDRSVPNAGTPDGGAPQTPPPSNAPPPNPPGPSNPDPALGGPPISSPPAGGSSTEPPLGGGAPPTEPPPNGTGNAGDPGTAPPPSGTTGP